MKIYLLVIAIFLTGACSNKAMYDNIQLDNRRDCVKLPPSQYEECMEKTSETFEEYEKERAEALEEQ